MNRIPVLITLCLCFGATAAAAQTLPDPTDPAFCGKVQQILANTEMTGTVTLFDNMDEYRASKPAPRPLMNYQIVTYNDQGPIAVSCKVKTADHLRAEYGENAAGEQLRCPAVTQITLDQTVKELQADGATAAAAVAREFVVDQNEPYITGSSYLSSFELSYQGNDGRIHIQSPGLQVDWENLWLWIMPNRVRGQTYCHLATVPYLKALAQGDIAPGTVIVSTDDARTTPTPAMQQSHLAR